jgi:hypothetical protein
MALKVPPHALARLAAQPEHIRAWAGGIKQRFGRA